MSIDYDAQLKSSLDFIEDTPYIHEVLYGVSKIDKIDRNSLYELIYLKEKLGIWYNSNISEDLSRAVKGTYDKLNIIISSLSADTINKIIKSNINKPRTFILNSKKYKNNPFKNIRNLSEKESNYKVSFLEYLKRTLVRILPTTIVAYLVLSGAPNKLAKFIVESETAVNNTAKISGIDNTIIGVLNIAGSLIGWVSIIILMITIFKIVVDILYMNFPFVKRCIDSIKITENIVSNDCTDLMLEFEYNNTYKNIDLLDKINFGDTLLSNLYLLTKSYKNDFNEYINANEYLKYNYNNVDNLHNIINKLKSVDKKETDILRLESLAKAELIHNDFYLLITELNKKYIKE